jgi:hypothetical protein
MGLCEEFLALANVCDLDAVGQKNSYYQGGALAYRVAAKMAAKVESFDQVTVYTLQTANEALKKQQLADKGKLQTLRRQYDDLCGQLNAAWYKGNYNCDVVKMKQDLNRLSGENGVLLKERQSLQDDVENLRIEKEEWKGKCYKRSGNICNLMQENDELQELCGSLQLEITRLRKLVIKQPLRDTTATYETCKSTHIPSDPVETLFAACGTPVKMVTKGVVTDYMYDEFEPVCDCCEEVDAYIARNDELDSLNEDAIFTIDSMNDDLAAIREVLGIGEEDSIIDAVKTLFNRDFESHLWASLVNSNRDLKANAKKNRAAIKAFDALYAEDESIRALLNMQTGESTLDAVKSLIETNAKMVKDLATVGQVDEHAKVALRVFDWISSNWGSPQNMISLINKDHFTLQDARVRLNIIAKEWASVE